MSKRPKMTDTESLDCLIVGAGPGGMMLAHMLARSGVSVALLEAHQDFDRQFRGDTLQPSAMEILDSLGLADTILALPHEKLTSIKDTDQKGEERILTYQRLPTKFPFVTILSQPLFLQCIAEQSLQYPNFQLHMGARVKELLLDGERVCGVRANTKSGEMKFYARLVVGADGRFSTVRKLSQLSYQTLGKEPYDVLWFRMPREPNDPSEGMLNIRVGSQFFVMFKRPNEWQVGSVIPKGFYKDLRQGPTEVLWRELAANWPVFADRLKMLRSWSDFGLLSVTIGRVKKWYREGLLLIGDAAHVMSPVGGVGINLAIQDAAVAATHIAKPLRQRKLRTRHLAAVQRKRMPDTFLIQGIQVLIQKAGLNPKAKSKKTPRWAQWLRGKVSKVPGFRDLPARLFGLGLRRVKLNPHKHFVCSPSPQATVAPKQK